MSRKKEKVDAEKVYKEVKQILNERRLPPTTSNLFLVGLEHIENKYPYSTELKEGYRNKIIENMKERKRLVHQKEQQKIKRTKRKSKQKNKKGGKENEGTKQRRTSKTDMETT